MNKNSARRLVRGVFGSALVALAIAASPQVSQAHAGNESYVYLNVAETDLRGQVEMPYSDLREVLGLELTGDDAAIRAELEAQLPELQSYADSHLSIGTASTTWALDFDGVETLKEFYDVDDGEYAILPFVVDLGGIEVPQTLDVTFDPFFDEIEGRSSLLLIANDWKRGVFDNETRGLGAVRRRVAHPHGRSGCDEPVEELLPERHARTRSHQDRSRPHLLRARAAAAVGARVLDSRSGRRPQRSDRRCGACSRSSRCSRSPTRSRSRSPASTSCRCHRRKSSRRSSPHRSPPLRSTT